MKRLFREISAALLVLALLLAPMPSAAQYTGSATGGGAGASAWGAITGTLSNQTDLNTALGGKAALVGGNSFTGGTNSFSGNLTNVQSAGTQLLVQGTTGSTDPAFVMDSGNVADFMYFRLGGVEQAQVTVTNGTITYWVNSHIFNTHGGTRLLSLDSTAVNIGTGVPLQNNGTTILSGSGVLQAAGVPAFAGGDVTSAGGSLVLTIPNGTVTLAKQANMCGPGASAKAAAGKRPRKRQTGPATRRPSRSKLTLWSVSFRRAEMASHQTSKSFEPSSTASRSASSSTKPRQAASAGRFVRHLFVKKAQIEDRFDDLTAQERDGPQRRHQQRRRQRRKALDRQAAPQDVAR
jgi:hypothetical protein